MEKEEMFNVIHPIQTNRWRLNFPEEFNIKSWVVKHVTPVRFDAEKKEWEDLTVTLYDPITNSTSKSLSEMIEGGRYHNFDMMMTMLGPVGDTVEEFYFKKCNFKIIDFGETDYEKDYFKCLTLTINYKKCVVR